MAAGQWREDCGRSTDALGSFTEQRASRTATLLVDIRKRWVKGSGIGLEIANSISNAVLVSSHVVPAHMGALAAFNGAMPTLSAAVERETLMLHPKLIEVVDDLRALLGRMTAAHGSISATGNAPSESYQGGADPVPNTGPAACIGDSAVDLPTLEHASSRLLQAHAHELEVRQVIADSILRVTERQQQLLLLSAWLHEPYVDAVKNESMAVIESAASVGRRRPSSRG